MIVLFCSMGYLSPLTHGFELSLTCFPLSYLPLSWGSSLVNECLETRVAEDSEIQLISSDVSIPPCPKKIRMQRKWGMSKKEVMAWVEEIENQTESVRVTSVSK